MQALMSYERHMTSEHIPRSQTRLDCVVRYASVCLPGRINSFVVVDHISV